MRVIRPTVSAAQRVAGYELDQRQDAAVLLPHVQPSNTKVKVLLVDLSLPHAIYSQLTRTGIAPVKKAKGAAKGDGDKKKKK